MAGVIWCVMTRSLIFAAICQRGCLARASISGRFSTPRKPASANTSFSSPWSSAEVWLMSETLAAVPITRCPIRSLHRRSRALSFRSTIDCPLLAHGLPVIERGNALKCAVCKARDPPAQVLFNVDPYHWIVHIVYFVRKRKRAVPCFHRLFLNNSCVALPYRGRPSSK